MRDGVLRADNSAQANDIMSIARILDTALRWIKNLGHWPRGC